MKGKNRYEFTMGPLLTASGPSEQNFNVFSNQHKEWTFRAEVLIPVPGSRQDQSAQRT